MFEKPLTGVRRWSWLAAAVMSACVAVVFAAAAILAPAEFPIYGRVTFVIGVAFGIAFAALGLRVFKRGTINLKTDTTWYYGMAWALPLVMVTLFMMFAPNDLIGLRMIVSGIVFLIGGAVFLLRGVAEQLELQTREKLLEIEYRLAVMEELLRTRQ